jgi:hypothetical protein
MTLAWSRLVAPQTPTVSSVIAISAVRGAIAGGAARP